MKQEIKKIKIKELHLWTENPRDPIGEDVRDLEIIKRAIKNDNKKWNLPKLINNMGDFYHFNKLPIVVFKDDKYIIYDGNCRIAILKYLQNPKWAMEIEGKLFPTKEPSELKKMEEIPCALCNEQTALNIIYHDNLANNTWTPLVQSYFEHYHLNHKKSLFLMFEEATGLVSSNEILNKRFVKDDILTKENLLSIGFKIKNDKLISMYQRSDAKEILNILIELIETGKINTRNDQTKGSIRVKRGGELKSVIERLSPDVKGKIAKFDNDKKQNEFLDFAFQNSEEDLTKQINTQKTPGTTAGKDWIMDKEYRKYKGADKVKYLLKEMKLLDPKTNAHVLMPSLRVLLELALYHKLSQGKHIKTIIDQYKRRIQKKNAERIKKDAAIIELKKNWSPSFRKMLIYISDENNNILTDPSARKELDKLIKKEGDFITDLNDFIHNVHSISGKDDPEKYWKKFARPFLNIIEDIK